MWKKKRVMLVVTGGIAVYKACDLASKLTQKGADVKVVMTEDAMKFVPPLTFQALTRNEVYYDTFIENDPSKIAHIDVADWAEIVIIAPATANVIGKLANGIADDMVTTTLLATRAEKYVAPAMNVHMYENEIVQQNMRKLHALGYHFIEPGAGYLACGYVGKGRLEEPITIIETIASHEKQEHLFTGKKILVSAGPTREAIDPVRFFTNHSSGKMGFAIAEQAAKLGAEVTLVTGPVQLSVTHPNIQRIDVTTAEEMYEAIWQHYNAVDIVVKAAAVADYRPKETYTDKMKKQKGDLMIEMERTKDILQSLGEKKQQQFLVGFAAETKKPLEYGADKLVKKNLDAIVINNVAQDGAGFGADTNIVTYMNKKREKKHIPLATKEEIAEQIWQLIYQDMKEGS
ncbi:MAG TPA: bifunctional phosphopantothenoylcysteine decarboxylase/phosphopantothenate--cysteine ligase CoaBC [Pseudogracilibacillus sp.]|nr:bifunctional phosphopantothenoylcysteine decarboxylase/phosphopantothenate--cysteine ligase CoaBC [Pseudogracilibacillus sp.]